MRTESIVRTSENPSRLLLQKHEKDVFSARESLFAFLKEKSPAMSLAAKEILERKLNKASEENLPLMFELFPWIIKDLTGLGWKKTHEISINWLAINLYVYFLDDHLDSKTEIRAEEFLGASVLAQKGLLNLFKIVSGTKFEKLFNESLFSSASFQLEDVLNQQVVSENNFAKAKSASGKNQILIACAGAFAASKEKDAKFIIQLTKKILLTVQFLDDLADFEDDFKSNNITVLLNKVIKENKLTTKDAQRNEIVFELISTGSLLNVIHKIESSLSASITLIEGIKIKNKKSNPSYQFFTSLYIEVLLLHQLLTNSKDTFLKLPERQQLEIIEKIDKAISRIYLHT